MNKIKQWWIGFKEYVYQNVIAVNQLINAAHGGCADETICSRAWRNRDRNPYKWYVPILDGMFYPFQGPDHCRRAYQKELERRHYPKGFGKDAA